MGIQTEQMSVPYSSANIKGFSCLQVASEAKPAAPKPTPAAAPKPTPAAAPKPAPAAAPKPAPAAAQPEAAAAKSTSVKKETKAKPQVAQVDPSISRMQSLRTIWLIDVVT